MPLSFLKRLLFLLLIPLTVGAGCTKSSDPLAEKQAREKIELEVWGPNDEEDGWRTIMDAYRKTHPNVSFAYKQLLPSEYEAAVVRGFASGDGPDIFAVKNTEIDGYRDLIVSLPSSLQIPVIEEVGTLKKEQVASFKTHTSVAPKDLRKTYVDVVVKDVLRAVSDEKGVVSEQIFALPMSVDTLALYANKDLLNAAGIAEIPRTWETFHAAVEKLTLRGEGTRILQSGASFGTGTNSDHAFDLLSILMLQNGTRMVSERGQLAFGAATVDRPTPGLDALRFYVDFADPARKTYTWNNDQPRSIDAFVSGKTAFYIGYAAEHAILKKRAPKLSIAIAPLPQIGDPTASAIRVVNYANYHAYAVAKSSSAQTWAWHFLQFATEKAQADSFISTLGLPTARRDLIEGQLADEKLEVFASQLLTAESWYHGKEFEKAEKAFERLIEAVRSGDEADKAFDIAQNAISQTL